MSLHVRAGDRDWWGDEFRRMSDLLVVIITAATGVLYGLRVIFFIVVGGRVRVIFFRGDDLTSNRWCGCRLLRIISLEGGVLFCRHGVVVFLS